MNVKPIIQKHGYDMIAGTTMYSENLIGIKLNTPVRKVEKPFFIGFAILDMSKHIIYDFFLLQRAQDDIRQRRVIGGRTRTHSSYNWAIKGQHRPQKKMCDMYKSFDFSELDNTSYFFFTENS